MTPEKKDKTIQTEHFTLRPFQKGDEATLQKNINNPDVAKTLTRVPFPYTEKHAKEWVARVTNPELKNEIHFIFDFGKGVEGAISLDHLNQKDRSAELGYWLAQPRWGNGHMTEAAKAITTYAFTNLNLIRIYAYTFLNNPASSRVLEKAGFKKEGILRKAIGKEGKHLDANLYALINPEFE